MNLIQKFFAKLLRIYPASEQSVKIKEPMSFETNVLKNTILYRSDPVEIEQFFKAVASTEVEAARFWAATPHTRIRKLHSGIVKLGVSKLSDIVTSDLNGIDFDNATKELIELWEKISKQCDFRNVLTEGIQGALYSGDGAFKVTIDKDGWCPNIEFYTAENVQYVRRCRKLQEILFYTTYEKNGKTYRLQEKYGKGYIKYKLFNEYGKEELITTIDELEELKDTTFNGDFIMAVPLIFFPSAKWQGRGDALFDEKTDDIDALDEVISQWWDAFRQGRVNKYIPEDFLPRDKKTGNVLPANPFDNTYIATAMDNSENASNTILVAQPDIKSDQYILGYSTAMDLVLQGKISPATLGIDLKKLDNADAQREKKETTIATRNKLVSVLSDVIPELVSKIMIVYDLMNGPVSKQYNVSVKFGEYSSPGFEEIVETVGKAKSYGIMSLETCINEMYGDTWTEKEKEKEIERLNAEAGFDYDGDSND